MHAPAGAAGANANMMAAGGAKPATGAKPGEDIFLSSTEEVLNLLCGGGPADLGTMPSRSRSNSAASTDPFDADEAFPIVDDLPSGGMLRKPFGRLADVNSDVLFSEI